MPNRRIRAQGALTVLVLGTFTLLAPSAASAQSPVPPGTLSMSFGLDGKPEAGIWFTATTHTRLGLIGLFERQSRTVDGPGETSETETTMLYAGGPALKWYLATNQQRVAPYWYLAGLAGVEDLPGDARTTRFTGDFGFGTDWFIIPQASIGGTTGISLGRERTSGGSVTVTDTMIRSFTMGLKMHIYF
jgi:hypothetical protein